MTFVDFTSERQALQFKTKAERLGWTCSTPFQNPDLSWSVVTNRP